MVMTSPEALALIEIAGAGFDALGGKEFIPMSALDVEYEEWFPDSVTLAS